LKNERARGAAILTPEARLCYLILQTGSQKFLREAFKERF
jgi:hypothetical protein